MDRKRLYLIISILTIIVAVFVVSQVVQRQDDQVAAPSIIRMASLLPLDGQVASYGEMMRNGQLLAVEEINRDSMSTPIEVTFFNTSHMKDVALDRLREAHQNGYRLVVEIFGSDQANHCLPFAIENGLTILSGVDTRPDLIRLGKGAFYRIMPNDAAAAAILVQWTQELGVENIGIVYVNDDWGKGLYEEADNAARQRKVNVAIVADVIRHQSSFAGTVAKLKSNPIDAVMLFIYPDDGGNLIKEIHRQRLNTRIFATENFTGDDMINAAGDAAIGVMLAVPKPSEDSTTLSQFQEQYVDRYGADPSIFAIKGYDAVKTLYIAAVQSGADPLKTRETIRDLAIPGVGGFISFAEDGEFIPGEYDRLVYTKEGENLALSPWTP